MATKNLPCEKKLGRDKCDGELILIDGSESRTRLRCSKCDRVVIFKMSLMQFAKLLKEREDMKDLIK